MAREINQAFDNRILPWAEDVQSRLSTITARQSALFQFSDEIFGKLGESGLNLSDLGMDGESSLPGILCGFSKYFLDVSLGSTIYTDNPAASLNAKVDMIHHAVQRLGQLDEIRNQGQEPAASAGITKSRLNNSDGVVAPMPSTLCQHMPLHSVPVFEDPVLLDAKTLAKKDVSKAVKLLLYSLRILIREYL